MSDIRVRDAYRMHQEGRVAEAIRAYEDILDTDPSLTDALYLLGAAHFQRGAFADALPCYDRAVAQRPESADLLLARGATLSNLHRHEDALAAYDAAIARNPAHAMAWNYRANALLEFRRYGEAVESFDRALKLKSDLAMTWRHRGLALAELTRYDEALESFSRAISLDPRDLAALEDRAHLLVRLGKRAEAIADFDRALVLKPGNEHLLYARANALSVVNRFTEAIRDCEACLSVAPDYPYARGVLVHSKLNACDWRGLEGEKVKIAAGIAAGKRVVSPFNHKALSDSAAEQLQCARVWVANECPAAPAFWRGETYTHDRIRLAYVSADFNTNANAFLMAGVYEEHDKSRFETIAISLGQNAATPMRARLEAAFERFHDVRENTAFEIATLMRALEIDIAVDLMGFTGECRPQIFAHRPAPLQVNYLGFPGTTGADYIDYILADRVLVPEESARHYHEQIVYLPNSYQANDTKRPRPGAAMTRAQAGLPERGFVFCSFNNNYKFTAAFFDIWMRLLRDTPESVLWLLQDNATPAANLKREAAARGIDPERVIFAPRVALAEHMTRQTLADLLLDTLPCNAHTTASDALWAGVPVLTCAGESFAGRVASSLLHAMDLPELVTHSIGDYEALARDLARNPARLATLRAKIARNREISPLFDTKRITRDLESAYATMWERQQRKLPPQSFAVAP